MPAGAVGTCWSAGTWPATAWEADAWADGAQIVRLPANIIVATQTVTETARRVSHTQVERRITFDG